MEDGKAEENIPGNHGLVPLTDTISFRYLKDGKKKLKLNMIRSAIDVNVAKYKVPALMDSGAMKSGISDAFHIALTKQKRRMKSVKCRATVYTADGAPHKVEKMVKLHFKIAENPIEHWVMVIPNLNKPIILGIDFFRKHKAKLKYGDEIPQNYSIKANKNILLPPHCEYETSIAVLSHEPLHETMGVIENVYRKSPVSYLLKRHLVTPTQNDHKVRICMFNTSDTPQRIKKGQPIAIYSLRGEDDFIPGGSEWGRVELGVREELQRDDNMSDQPDSSSSKSEKFKIGDELENEERSSMIKLLQDYDDQVFYKKGEPLSATPLYEHRIDWKKDATPKFQKHYRMNPVMAGEMWKILKEQEQQDIIEPCTEEIENASPAFLVEKPRDPETGELQYRMVIDYRNTNQNIKTQVRSFTPANEALEKVSMGDNKYYSKLDAVSGFSQIKIRKGDRKITAFTTPFGSWQMKRLPMGLKTSPKAFAHVIEGLVRHMPNIVPYMDDLCVKSPTFEQHMIDLKGLFEVFKGANLKFKKEKCHSH